MDVQSEVWVDGLEEAVGWKFRLVSDAYIVNGIGNIMCDCMEGLSTSVEALQWEDFNSIRQISSLTKKKQGMQALPLKCVNSARRIMNLHHTL